MIETAFLDRDGVINRKAPDGEYVTSWDDFRFLPGAIEALRSLRDHGVRVVVVTNQRGVALRRMTRADVDSIHRAMTARLDQAGAGCAAVLVCPHDDGECDCRKPALGLFHQARTIDPDISFASSIVVGDSAADVIAGNRLGCPTYLVADPERRDEILDGDPALRVDGVASSLLELVRGTLRLGDPVAG